MVLDGLLESLRVVLGCGLVVAGVAVWYGVWLERDSAPQTVKDRGWQILVYGLAAETALGFLVFAADTTLGVRQKHEIEVAEGAAFKAESAADIAIEAGVKLRRAITIENSAQQLLRDENSKLRSALDSADDDIVRLKRQEKEISEQVAADHSVKARIRNLFASVDPNILRCVDSGVRSLTVRMQSGDIAALRRLLGEPGAKGMVKIVAIGRTFTDSTIANGTLGPQTAVTSQTELILQTSSELELAFTTPHL